MRAARAVSLLPPFSLPVAQHACGVCRLPFLISPSPSRLGAHPVRPLPMSHSAPLMTSSRPVSLA
eukprot:1376431-Prymnesium_polylepis.1